MHDLQSRKGVDIRVAGQDHHEVGEGGGAGRHVVDRDKVHWAHFDG